VAEAMFWGCLPIVTPISCVPNMLNQGQRGILLCLDKKKDIENIEQLVTDSIQYEIKTNAAMNWSRYYTVDKFEAEIKKLLRLKDF
jgi:hypothetical protein